MWEDNWLFNSARAADRTGIELRQYLDTHDQGELILPEKRLMLVVLEDALECLNKYAQARNKKHRRVFEQADQWVFAAADDGVFSFENVCEALDLNPAFIRKGVRRLAKTKEIAKPPANE